jgi:hypothetical protein
LERGNETRRAIRRRIRVRGALDANLLPAGLRFAEAAARGGGIFRHAGDCRARGISGVPAVQTEFARCGIREGRSGI